MAFKDVFKDAVADIGSFMTLGQLPSSNTLKAKEEQIKIKDSLKNSPKYSTPDAINQYLGIYRDQASQQKMPGYGQQEQQIKNQTNEAVSNIQDSAATSGAALGGLSDIYRKELASLSQLNQMSDQYVMQARNQYGGALLNSANYADKEYQFNQLDPYLRQINFQNSEMERNFQLGQQKEQDYMGIAANALSFGMNMKSMNNQMPNYGQQQTTQQYGGYGTPLNITPQYNYGQTDPLYINPYQTGF